MQDVYELSRDDIADLILRYLDEIGVSFKDVKGVKLQGGIDGSIRVTLMNEDVPCRDPECPHCGPLAMKH